MKTPDNGEVSSEYKPPVFRLDNKLNNEIEFNRSINGKIENFVFKRIGAGKYVTINKLKPKERIKFEFKSDKGEVLEYKRTSKLIGDIFKDSRGREYYILPDNRTAHRITNTLKTINFIKEQIMHKIDLSYRYTIDNVKKSNKYGIYLEFFISAEKIKTFFTSSDGKVTTGKTSKKEVDLPDLDDKALKLFLIEASLHLQNVSLSKADKCLYLKTISLIYNKDSSVVFKSLLSNGPLGELASLKKVALPFFKKINVPLFFEGIDIAETTTTGVK